MLTALESMGHNPGAQLVNSLVAAVTRKQVTCLPDRLALTSADRPTHPPTRASAH